MDFLSIELPDLDIYLVESADIDCAVNKPLFFPCFGGLRYEMSCPAKAFNIHNMILASVFNSNQIMIMTNSPFVVWLCHGYKD